MKVALVSDWLTNMAGAERFMLELTKMFPDAPLYTSVFNKEKMPLFKDVEVRSSFIQKIPLARTKHQLFPFLRRKAFEKFDFSDFDLVISISGAEAKGIKTGPKTTHINLCNSPTHYYWSHYDEYLENPGFGWLNPIARMGLSMTINGSRKWDYKAAQRPDYIVSISNAIKDRVKKYYDRDSIVIAPPTDTSLYKPKKKMKREGYLVVGRQVPYKRIDLPVLACTELGYKLNVVGDGPVHEELKVMAGDTVTFHGRTSDQKMRELYQHAEAFIFPNEDDFGLVPVEAMSAGAPVLAFAAGGALDTIDPGKTGEHFKSQDIKEFTKALKKFDPSKYKEKDILARAEMFGVKAFRDKLGKYIDEVMKESK